MGISLCLQVGCDVMRRLLVTSSPFEGELAFFFLLGLRLEDESFGQFHLDDHLAAGCALRECDQDAAGEVFADLDGELVGARFGCDA